MTHIRSYLFNNYIGAIRGNFCLKSPFTVYTRVGHVLVDPDSASLSELVHVSSVFRMILVVTSTFFRLQYIRVGCLG